MSDSENGKFARTRIGVRGRITIPVALQKAAGVAENDKIVIRVTGEGTFVIETPEVIKKRVMEGAPENWREIEAQGSCETTDFFEADKLYISRVDPYRAPEFTPEFWCKLVTTHPTQGVLWAVGWTRKGHFDPWDANLAAYRLDEWRREKWAEAPYADKEGGPAA